MATPPNVHFEGAVYHVGARGVRQTDIFRDDYDRAVFVAIVKEARKKYKFSILCWCLMSNHFHLLIQVSRAPIGRIMQSILTRYARHFNKRHGTSGRVFDRRYFKKLVRVEDYLAAVIRYIHGNPVQAGMVAKSADWRWSSARQFECAGEGLADLGRVRELFGGELPEGLTEPLAEVPSAAYVPDRLAPCLDEPAIRPDLEAIAAAVLAGSVFGLSDLRGDSRITPLPQLRTRFFQRAVLAGAAARDAGRYLNRKDARVAEALAELTRVTERVRSKAA